MSVVTTQLLCICSELFVAIHRLSRLLTSIGWLANDSVLGRGV